MGRDVGSGGKGEEMSGYGDDRGEIGDEDDNGDVGARLKGRGLN